jgi:hypothetical protein
MLVIDKLLNEIAEAEKTVKDLPAETEGRLQVKIRMMKALNDVNKSFSDLKDIFQ